MVTTVIALVALHSALLPAKSSAGINTWTTHGPEGGSVSSLVIDNRTPTTLYAGTKGGGVFKSTNSGKNWKAMNTGLISTNITALAIDPSSPATLYAGASPTHNDTAGPGGILKSSNGGESWTGSAFNSNWGWGSILALVIDPSAPQTIYAAVQDSGILKSTDGGASWTLLPYGDVRGVLAIGPSAPATLYVGRPWPSTLRPLPPSTLPGDGSPGP